MPRYDYRCTDGHTYEALVAVGARDVVQECPACGAAARRLFTPSTNIQRRVSTVDTGWGDVAPHDEDGRIFDSPKQAFKSGKFEPADKRVAEQSRKHYEDTRDFHREVARKETQRDTLKKFNDPQRVRAVRKANAITVRTT